MSDFLKNFKQYLKLPEMKILWLFLFLILIVLAINIKFIGEPILIAAMAVIFSGIGIMIFFVNVQTAKLKLSVKIEKNRLESIISSLNDGIIIYDTAFKITIFNKAAEEIFGLHAAQIMGKIITPEEVKNQELKILTQVIFPSLAPAVLRKSDADVYPQVADISFIEPELELRVTTNHLIDEDGQIIGFLKIIRNRTREKELLQAKSDFITIAAHQLRTPLSAISWALESLQKEPLNESQKELTGTALGASKNLLKIVEDLLNVAEIEEGKFGYNFQELDLAQFLRTSLSEAELVARKYKINLFMQPISGPLMVYADPKKLGLVLSNLLTNAIRYNIANGQVTASAKKIKDKPFVQISIADTGIGMPPDDLNKLFTKFFRGGNALKVQADGSGLGLYIVKNIIQRHGGEIWAESELGRGSVFHFTLPIDSRMFIQKENIFGEV